MTDEQAGDLRGQVALVTGAAGGIGRAVAIALARDGATTVVADIDESGLADTVAAIEAAGGRATAVRCDVTDEGDVAAAVERAATEYGGLDIAVNNAGVEQPVGPLHEVSINDFDRLQAVNVRSVFVGMRAQVPPMLKTGRGAIVNLSSGAGVVGIQGQAAYCASKHAVIGMTKAAALDYADAGIRVNAVCPGIIETPMMDRFSGGTPEGRARVIAQEPIGRMGRPDEIADAVRWLVSDRSSFVVGHALVVDGGQTI